MEDSESKEDITNSNETWFERYQPLLVLIVVILISAIALSSTEAGGNFMRYFMGLFLVNFSVFKLMRLRSFANRFAKYDIIAKRSKPYAFVYPFIELLLGLMLLSNSMLTITYAATFIIMTVGAIGIINEVLIQRRPLDCACLGTVINVPLGPVSILENVGMSLMAAYMLFAAA